MLELLPTAKEVYPIIKSKIKNKWQKEWTGHINCRHMIDPNLMSRITQYSENSKLDVIYTSLRLGVNRLQANNIFHGMANPMCDFCKEEIEDTDHYLIYCPQHHEEREILKRNNDLVKSLYHYC